MGWMSPRASAISTVAQMCLQGSPVGVKYGQLQATWSLPLRSRRRTRYLAVPRTRAATSPAVAPVITTRPLAKYDCPRERTASLNSLVIFWAIPIIRSQTPWRQGLAKT